jgi:hypothetical protein
MKRHLLLKELFILLGILAPMGILGGLGFAWGRQRFHWNPGTIRIVLIGLMILLCLCGAYLLYRYARALGKEDDWKE